MVINIAKKKFGREKRKNNMGLKSCDATIDTKNESHAIQQHILKRQKNRYKKYFCFLK